MLFSLNSPADDLYLLESGCGALLDRPSLATYRGNAAAAGLARADSNAQRCPVPAVVCHVDFTQSTVHSRAQMTALPAGTQPSHVERRFAYGPGSIVGELDFFIQRPRR